MKIISESEMNFGVFDESDLFYIEKSQIYHELGEGIKTVEFILKYDNKSIVFLEAKKSCPNTFNRFESEEKEKKFEEYYSSITDKFTASLQIYLAAILEKYDNSSEIGESLRAVTDLKNINLKFILVIKNVKDITWLAGPLAELKARLLMLRKIWNIELAVLDEELAGKYGLTC